MRFLEKRFGRFAIPNVTAIFIAAQVFAFVANALNPGLLDRMILIPERVLNGDVHRLVTYLAIPPGGHPLWAFFAWYLFYLMGQALEHYWGIFRYNLFILLGFLATTGAAFAAPDQPCGNGFLYGTVFLAFAFLNPNFELRLFFILPVKIKWLAGLTWIGYFFQFVVGDAITRLSVAAATANFFLFFGQDLYWRLRGKQRAVVRTMQKAREKKAEKTRYYHKCAVCGLTDLDDREMDFRYCSQCAGDQAYCRNHLREHAHVGEGEIA